jgi:hypothetical protein
MSSRPREEVEVKVYPYSALAPIVQEAEWYKICTISNTVYFVPRD